MRRASGSFICTLAYKTDAASVVCKPYKNRARRLETEINTRPAAEEGALFWLSTCGKVALQDDRYGALRNAAWLVRNSRVGQGNNPLALGVVVAEVEKLTGVGEALPDVIEALCELLVHP
jgi:hypothetical protein